MPILNINTVSYNPRRYGKPYIAKIDFNADPQGKAEWGQWVGSSGEAGMLILDASPGDVVMQGQKDYRGWGTRPDYRIVQPNGSLGPNITKLEAYKHAKSQVQGIPVG